MSIFNTASKETRTQLHFYGDGSFEFRKRPLEDSCLIEKVDGEIRRAWSHFHSGEIQFDGYKNIKPDMVTLSFDRDFILDPFKKIPVSNTTNGKPKEDEVSVKNWLSALGEFQRYKAMNKPGSMLLMDKITMYLGISLLLMVLGFLITRAGS